MAGQFSQALTKQSQAQKALTKKADFGSDVGNDCINKETYT